MSDVSCRAIRRTLSARVLDTGETPPIFEAHVSTCLRCQAVVASSRRLRRILAGMDDAGVDEDPVRRKLPSWVAAGAASLAAAIVYVRMRQEQR